MLPLLLRRPLSTSSRRLAQVQNETHDFRRPWVYRGVALLKNLLIPGVFFYAIFWYDFGEDDHVFLEPRRWALRKKAEFLTMSDEDRRLLGKPVPDQAKRSDTQ
ncbi:hypothetical protein BDV98DRAFT_604461 [Pterulicium gracile]|uniref:Uncharacterized protein n=1 Tax=Pterulicium gracile TaxID=1884261 RepID=A0A5C3QKW7_9AGAR|nr:hypothetical protein BDV98DRAFT_604461 [Pterula gracilis]